MIIQRRDPLCFPPHVGSFSNILTVFRRRRFLIVWRVGGRGNAGGWVDSRGIGGDGWIPAFAGMTGGGPE